MIDENRKMPNKDYFVFYGNLCGRNHSGDDCENSNCIDGKFGVKHTGDDPDGTSSDGDDDESIIIDIKKYQKIFKKFYLLLPLMELQRKNKILVKLEILISDLLTTIQEKK
jgi:tellurium resistance protein TerD